MRLGKNNDQTNMIFIISHNKKQAMNADSLEVSNKMGLDPDAEKYSVGYGSITSGDKEIELLTRSILGILVDLA